MPDRLLTAEEFLALPAGDCPTELVRGKVVSLEIHGFQHGKACNKLGSMLRVFADQHSLGEVLSRSGVVTQLNPDTVRGPDVLFYSRARLPKGVESIGYPSLPPELVCEVLSPGEYSANQGERAGEYLAAGVLMVCVVCLQERTIAAYSADNPVRIYAVGDVLEFPVWLGGFRFSLERIF